MVVDEEVRARAQAWNTIFAYINPTAVVCAVELNLPDIFENHGGPISLSELSAAAACPVEPLYRLLRFLIFHGIFKKSQAPPDAASPPPPSPSLYYAKTPLSRIFASDKLGAFMMLQGSPPSKHPVGLGAHALRTGKPHYINSLDGEDTWRDPEYGFNMNAFTGAMAAHARDTTALIIRNYPDAFHGIGSVVDVGGRHGMALADLVAAFPWVRGITFDLPQVVAEAPPRPGIEFVGGDMFKSVPKADVVLLMWVLHDWNDKSCIEILKKCKEAIPDSGKVMIVEAIIDEDGEGDEFAGARLSLDMIMMAVTVEGKERSYREWERLIKEAGFSRFTVKNINTIESVIEAYP